MKLKQKIGRLMAAVLMSTAATTFAHAWGRGGGYVAPRYVAPAPRYNFAPRYSAPRFRASRRTFSRRFNRPAYRAMPRNFARRTFPTGQYGHFTPQHMPGNALGFANPGTSSPLGHAMPGRRVTGNYHGHDLTHTVTGDRHRHLEGHTFHKPPQRLHDRLARLHQHHWHRHWKRVMIMGFGELACVDYCSFDVPVDTYGDFITAASEAQDDDDGGGGWSQAVQMLENAASEDDTSSQSIVEQPDQEVDVDLAGGEQLE